MNEVKIGKVYRHFKGNYYFVENIALDSETNERMVIYKSIYDNNKTKIWVRSEKMFLSKIDENREDNVTGQKYRFEIVRNLEKNYIK